MALHIHHIFVCTSVGAPEAGTLLDAGLVEGSPNTHPGQGTANRRFFFDSGFLELLWVHDEHEARSAPTAPTKLWDRWAERGKASSPFGLCFSSSQGLDSSLPFPTWAYRPSYLPDGRHILFVEKQRLSEPEIFVLSWPQAQLSPRTEPTRHSLGLSQMRSVSIGLPDPASISDTLSIIRDIGLVEIHRSNTPELVIEFTAQRDVRRNIPELGISLVGRLDRAS